MSDKLHQENIEMERKLKELKTSLRRRKEERGGGSVIWRSGRNGGIKSHVNEILKHNASRRHQTLRKVSVLGNNNNNGNRTSPGGSSTVRPRPPPRNTRPPQRPEAAATATTTMNPPSSKVPNLVPSDTSEPKPSASDAAYDEQASHASFLEALNEWRLGRATDALQTLDVGEGASSGTAAAQPEVPTVENDGGRLLDGTYDEAAAMQSFRDAVHAWRQAGQETPPPRPATTSTCQTVAGDEAMHRNIEIVFSSTSTLSYVERLMLAKHRSQTAQTTSRSDASCESLGETTKHSAATSITGADEGNSGSLDIVEATESDEDDTTAVVTCAVSEPDDDDDDGDDDTHTTPVQRSSWATPLPAPEDVRDPRIAHDDDDGVDDDNSGHVLVVEDADDVASDVDVVTDDTVVSAEPCGLVVPEHVGRDVITPSSLMHDFEEMEKSFTEELLHQCSSPCPTEDHGHVHLDVDADTEVTLTLDH